MLRSKPPEPPFLKMCRLVKEDHGESNGRCGCSIGIYELRYQSDSDRNVLLAAMRRDLLPLGWREQPQPAAPPVHMIYTFAAPKGSGSFTLTTAPGVEPVCYSQTGPPSLLTRLKEWWRNR